MRLKGGHYLEEAVALSLQDSSVFVMEMYQTIAERHNKGVASIEHIIWYLIEITYDKNRLNHFFSAVFRVSFQFWGAAEIVKKIRLISKKCTSFKIQLPKKAVLSGKQLGRTALFHFSQAAYNPAKRPVLYAAFFVAVHKK